MLCHNLAVDGPKRGGYVHSYTCGVVQARRRPGLELSVAPRAMGRGCAGGDSTTAEAKLKKSKLTAEVILSYLDAIFFSLPSPGKREVS